MKQLLKLVLTLYAIAAITALILAGVNAITKDRIAAAGEQAKAQAIGRVLPGARELKPVHFQDNTGLVEQVLAGDPDAAEFAVQVASPGFGGDILLMVGIRQGAVTGIAVVSHGETPNLGAVAAADSQAGAAFRRQFVGLKSPVAVTKDGGQIDAITSATITSRAVAQGVDAALQCVQSLS